MLASQDPGIPRRRSPLVLRLRLENECETSGFEMVTGAIGVATAQRREVPLRVGAARDIMRLGGVLKIFTAVTYDTDMTSAV